MIKILLSSGILAFGLLVILSAPVLGQEKQSEATVENLFQILVDEWAQKIEFTMFEGSVVTGDGVIGLSPEPNYNEAVINFDKLLRKAESAFGHLPEYWQLRAQIERDGGLEWLETNRGGLMTAHFANRLREARWNRDLLQKSLDIDPKDVSVKWYIDMLEIREEFEDEKGWIHPEEPDELKRYHHMMVDAYHDAGKLDPDNSFYPVYEAVYLQKLGDTKEMMNALEQAHECDVFNLPRIFPSNYALDVIDDFESEEGIFDDITPGAKFHLFTNFYDGSDAYPNYMHIKNLFKDIIYKKRSSDDLYETLNLLHPIACTIGKGEEHDSINYLTAIILVKICMIGAYERAVEENDYELERAVIAAVSEVRSPRLLSRWGATDESILYRFLFTMVIDQLKVFSQNLIKDTVDLKAPFITLSDFLKPTLPMNQKIHVHRKFVKPVFEDVESFDYTNPNEWYENWKLRTFGELYGTEEYRIWADYE